ncbi:MAG: myo-inosose-2 dehydratase [Geminicoccaceae bacterium]|nr:myo-inosose-2 dehydratase [Geminicoccaceae bacterium]
MAIRLGIAPIGWTNDDLPELGGDITLERCLTEAKAAGFGGVERGGKFPSDPAVLGPILQEHGLALVSGWFSGRLLDGSVEEEKARIRSQLDLYLAMGCPVMVYAETTGTVQGMIDTPVSARPVLEDDAIRAYGEKLTHLADWLKAEGCPLTFHHHMGTVIEKEREVDLLMENSGDSVGLLLDTGHLTFAGGDVPATTRRWGKRINHVHVKDVREGVLARLRAEDGSFLKGVLEGVFTVPGDGTIDFRAFMRVVKEIGYAGWVVVEAEQDPAKANPSAMARIGHDELKAACRDAGIVIAA